MQVLIFSTFSWTYRSCLPTYLKRTGLLRLSRMKLLMVPSTAYLASSTRGLPSTCDFPTTLHHLASLGMAWFSFLSSIKVLFIILRRQLWVSFKLHSKLFYLIPCGHVPPLLHSLLSHKIQHDHISFHWHYSDRIKWQCLTTRSFTLEAALIRQDSH